MPSIMPMRRKKWTEEEEATLISKYGEMQSNGILNKMKTREKKFHPIAAQVNMVHHDQDPVTFPWQWTWKDASTKVQNMRHQYLGVKQKIRKVGESNSDAEEYDWEEGLNHWSNFLKYKDVFGDVEIEEIKSVGGGQKGARCRDSVEGFGIGGSMLMGLDGTTNGVLGGLGFEDEENEILKEREDYEYDDVGVGDNNPQCSNNSSRRKRKSVMKHHDCCQNRVMEFFANQFSMLREREARLEDTMAEREMRRREREAVLAREEDAREERRAIVAEKKEKRRQEELKMWEMKEHEFEVRMGRLREESVRREREWEESMERRRLEWRKNMESMMRQHQAAMAQMQAQIVQSHQALITQLVGIMIQCGSGSGHFPLHPHPQPHPGDLGDHSGVVNPFINQVLQNLQTCSGNGNGNGNVNGVASPVGRGAVGNVDATTQYIVDG